MAWGDAFDSVEAFHDLAATPELEDFRRDLLLTINEQAAADPNWGANELFREVLAAEGLDAQTAQDASDLLTIRTLTRCESRLTNSSGINRQPTPDA